ncbi:CPBP family intramembrane metalloprotease [Paenibacillus psychroresistens]|uniref:CPBP family intramembrane metalloprotease n=1 Tax=Paenibacillus psychroresistens TaxID=1778678 RepID=A0A6B8RW18_9BACL|nr:type II CAAX endopeptidase family protein [Paenibacillus psychroresistens]QGQ99328.1 CPBP family intramembrane metalloprotease [Paenibacillus psychroresistens]
MKFNKTLRNVIIFSLVALSCGWIGRLIDLQVGTDENGSVGQLIWLVSPFLSIVIIRSWMGDGWKDFGIHFRMKGNILLYVFSVFFFPLMAFVIVGISSGLGWTYISQSSSPYLAAFGMVLAPSFIKNIFEEFAWRGYMAPKLFKLGYNRLLVHIAVGVIWSAWHFPYLFLFIDTTESMSTYIPRMMLGVIVLAVLYGEILLMTRSVWPAVVMHTMGNAFIDTLILKKFIHVNEETRYMAMPSPEGVMAIALTGLAGLWIYKKRKIMIPRQSHSGFSTKGLNHIS